jgi:hypothetical protein
MNDLRKAAEQALKQLQRDDVYLGHRSKTRADAIEALRQALAEPEDPRIVELRTLMAEPTVTGVIFEVHRGPLSKSIREFGDCPCPTYVEGDVRIEVKEKREWVGLTGEEARKFYEKYTNREELIYAIDEFLEEKNHESTQTRP